MNVCIMNYNILLQFGQKRKRINYSCLAIYPTRNYADYINGDTSCRNCLECGKIELGLMFD